MAAIVTNSLSKASIEIGFIGRIPVRNIWLLMLYASDLFRHLDSAKITVEENPDDIPELVAEILIRMVERRLMRNLTFDYQPRESVLSRVRGRIDLLYTERHQLLEQGKVACRYSELTVDTPRNRFVRSALDELAKIVQRADLSHRCSFLASSLRRMGVVGENPGRTEVSSDRFGRHDAHDRQMVTAAHLAFDLALPTEIEGMRNLSLPGRDIIWMRKLFEKAVAGFYDVVLSRSGWHVYAGKTIKWPIESRTQGIDRILPTMRIDIVLEQEVLGRRIIIDTKFNPITTKGWYREETLRSGYLYQIYAYLRSQENFNDSLTANAAGLLLHPSIGDMVDESVEIQGHEIRFATVDLAEGAKEIRNQLLQVVNVDSSRRQFHQVTRTWSG